MKEGMPIRWTIIAVAAYALSLPFLGPIVDCHLADRVPGHGHLYLGTIAPDHPHRDGAARGHGEDGGSGDAHSLSARHAPAPGRVVSVIPANALAEGAGQVAAVALAEGPLTLPARRAAFGLPEDAAFLERARASPSKKPPRPALFALS